MLKTMLTMWKTCFKNAFFNVDLLKALKIKRKFLYDKFTPLSIHCIYLLDFFAAQFILYILHIPNIDTECFFCYE